MDATQISQQVTRLKDLAARYLETNWPDFSGTLQLDVRDWGGAFNYPICFEYKPPGRYEIFVDEAFAPTVLRDEVLFLSFLEYMIRTCPENSPKQIDSKVSGKNFAARTSVLLQELVAVSENLYQSRGSLGLLAPGTIQAVDLPRTAKLGNTSKKIPTPPDGFVEPSWFPLLTDMVTSQHIQLMGPPGVGKSFAVERLAARSKKKLYNLNCDCKITRAHLEGTRELRKGDTQFKKSGFAEAAINGHWAKLDELNMAEPDAIISLNGITASPFVINLDGEQHPVHKDFRLFVTYNPGLTGTKSLPESLEDRLFPIIVPHPTKGELESILAIHKIKPNFCHPLASFAVKIWNLAQERQIRYELSVRRLLDAGLLLSKDYSWEEAIRFAVLPVIRNPNDQKRVLHEAGRF